MGNPSDEWPEVLYSFHLSSHVNGPLVVSKWLGGREPVERYTIQMGGQGRCDCLGALRNPICRHKKMVDRVIALVTQHNLPNTWGIYYNYDKDILYTPSDGEGVPWDCRWVLQFVKETK